MKRRSTTPCGSAPFLREAWLAAREFLKRAWFNRLWILQEFVLSKAAQIVCGSGICLPCLARDDGWSSYDINAPSKGLRDSIVNNKAFIIPPSAPQFCSPSFIPSHLHLLLQIPGIILPMPILNPHTPIIRLKHLLLSLRPADPIRLAARHDTHHLFRCR